MSWNVQIFHEEDEDASKLSLLFVRAISQKSLFIHIPVFAKVVRLANTKDRPGCEFSGLVYLD
jgi:hypothetical protein